MGIPTPSLYADPIQPIAKEPEPKKFRFFYARIRAADLKTT
jgi:hypothetical protein